MKEKTIRKTKVVYEYVPKHKIVSERFLNIEYIHPLYQRQVFASIKIFKKYPELEKVLIFGSAATPYCHVGSDLDMYLELSSEDVYLKLKRELLGICYDLDLWTNYSVDERLKKEILKKGVVVYERAENTNSQ